MVCQQMGWDASNKSKSRPKPNRDAELDKLYASYESRGCIFYEDSIGISWIKGQRRGNHFHPRSYDICIVQQEEEEKCGVQNQRNT